MRHYLQSFCFRCSRVFFFVRACRLQLSNFYACIAVDLRVLNLELCKRYSSQKLRFATSVYFSIKRRRKTRMQCQSV